MILWFLLIGVLAVVALLSYIYFNQHNMVFYPVKELVMTPEELNLSYEDIYIEVKNNEKIHSWFFPVDSGALNCKTVLFCHGNGGNISHRFETIDFISNIPASLLIFDYRGYGRSDGSPGENEIYEDARAAYDWLVNVRGIKPEDIVIFGRSLGGAVAVDLANRVECGGLIVESSFTSAKDMGKRIYPYVPISYLLKYRLDSIGKIDKINCPLLVVHSPDDELIPYEMGQRLFEKAKPPKKFVKLRGGHNECIYFDDPDYIKEIREILCPGKL